MAEQGRPAITVQVVRAPDSSARRTTRLGVGLLVSLVVGWPALRSALDGGDGFEAGVVRFLLTVAVSVGGVLLLGLFYDHFTGAAPTGATTTAGNPAGEEPQP